MKLKYSLFSRRKFLNALFGGGLLTFFTTLLFPIVKFIFPPAQEPDKVILEYAHYKDMNPYTSRMFAWGRKPGILVKKGNRYQAFLAVCTHLDCTVTFLPEKRKFYCACHEGWYDENGVNIAGPPPSPLKKLIVQMEGENIIIRNS
ncbi:MAG: Rieske (2Fe-2S) protein [Candidatus Bathyarchaeota archaeon]|nr:Rieske (2Fe-2S) protein [Candidatus Bathyarchaeota archaeon]